MREGAPSSVVITGASRGIGRTIATTFAKQTSRPLVLLARSNDDLQKTRRLCKEAGSAAVAAISCDLTNPDEVISLKLPEEVPVPEVLINNAGSFLISSLTKTDYSDFLNQIQTNLFSAVHTTNRFLNDLKSRERGLIINICSAGSLKGLKDSGAYASSKHALLGYTRSLRKELMETNIGVTAINLGQTQSTSWQGSDVDPSLLIDPKDVARLLVTLTQLSGRTLAEEIILSPQHGHVPPM